MGFYVGMIKIDENEDTVSYKFDIDVKDKEVVDMQGRSYFTMKTIYGHCTFNKKTKEFILNKENTDPYFFKSKEIVDCVNIKLLRILRTEDFFPERTCFAS